MSTPEQPRAMTRQEYVAHLKNEIGLDESELNKAHVFIHECTCGQKFCYGYTLEHERTLAVNAVGADE
jgi:hypothetical protein